MDSRGRFDFAVALFVLLALGGCAGAPEEADAPGVPRPASLDGVNPHVAGFIDNAIRVIEDDPGAAFPRAGLAMIYHAHDMFELSRTAYEQALAIEPDNARWLYHVADVRHALGDGAGAMEAIDRSIELEPGYPASYRRRAQWRLENDAAAAAEEDFRRAIRMAPQDASGHYGLARALTAQGRGEEAHAVLTERGLTSGEPPDGEDPWTDSDISRFKLDFNAYLGYVEALAAVGDYEQALREFEALLQSRPEDARLLLQTGRTYLALGQEERALETLERGIELHPADPLLLAEAAAVYRALGQPEQALERLDRAIELSPGDGLIHARRAVILQALQRYPEAAESYRQALTHRPRDLRVMLLYGDCLSRMQLFGEAASVFRHALTIDENNAELHARFGVALHRLGRGADAEAALARALELEPGNTQWAEWLAEWRAGGAS